MTSLSRTGQTPQTSLPAERTQRLIQLALDNSLYVALIAVIALFSVIAAPYNFLTFGNLANILISAAVLGLIACGLTIAVLAGQIDLSTAGVSGLGSIVAGVLFQVWAWPAPAALLAVLVIGALAGLLTSTLIVNVKIYSLIASLSVVGLYTGLAMLFSRNLQIPLARLQLQQLLFYRGILGIPVTVWVMFVLYVLGYVMLNHTRLGAHIYATGANYTAARLAGVPVNRVIRIALMMSGVTIALAAALVTARGNITILYGAAGGLQSSDALTAVLLGGVSLFGGTGKIERNLVAVLFLVVVQNGLTLMSVPLSGWYLARGAAFLLAVTLDVVRARMGQAG
jgi:ribose transport system permease protein